MQEPEGRRGDENKVKPLRFSVFGIRPQAQDGRMGKKKSVCQSCQFVPQLLAYK